MANVRGTQSFCGGMSLGILYPLFFVFCNHLDFCALYSLVFSPDMVGEFLYPLYVYHFIYP